METLIANLAVGKARREKLGERDYLVAPMTLIVPGVLPGSKGPLLYPEEELSKNPEVWNGIPIVLNHPYDNNGNPLSGRRVEVLDRSGLGMLMNSGIKDGKLVAEGWFEINSTTRVSPTVLASLEAGIPLELSTGLYTTNEPAEEGAAFNGKPFTHIARNYSPDHLAILPDKEGACSIRDGCGVLVNKSKLEEPEMAKKELVDNLISNCCCWEEEDRETLNAMSEDKLKKLVEGMDTSKENEAVANAAREGFKAGNFEFSYDTDKGEFVANETKPKKKEEPKPTVNTAKEPDKELTSNEWLEKAPPEIRQAVNNAIRIDKEEKTSLIETITANENNPFSKEQLEAMNTDQLRPIATLAKVKAKETTTTNNYAGASSPPDGSGSGKKDFDKTAILGLPTINWKKEKEAS